MVRWWDFSDGSKAKLETCHPSLRDVVYRSKELSPFKFMVTAGHRNQAAQDKVFAEGFSRTPWPKSKHNSDPSLAVDLAPLEESGAPISLILKDQINWRDVAKFATLGGVMYASAALLGVRLRWGGDFDQDWKLLGDIEFKDWAHFELLA